MLEPRGFGGSGKAAAAAIYASRTCVQPFRNSARSPPQPRTRAWTPSLVTWSHQEMFSCSSSGHPSLRMERKSTWQPGLFWQEMLLLQGRIWEMPVCGTHVSADDQPAPPWGHSSNILSRNEELSRGSISKCSKIGY